MSGMSSKSAAGRLLLTTPPTSHCGWPFSSIVRFDFCVEALLVVSLGGLIGGYRGSNDNKGEGEG